MWLPKDERRLLSSLYHLLHVPGRSKGYEHWEFIKMLRWRGWREVKAYGETGAEEVDGATMDDMAAFKKEVRRAGSEDRRAQQALQSLEKCQLIVTKPHQSEPGVCFVELSVTGWDLGRRYASPLSWMGVWVREYRWVWGLVTLLLGALLAELVHLVGYLFKK